MSDTMSARLLPALVIFFAMIAAPMLAETTRPTRKAADEGPKVDLEAMIPKQFGEWHIDGSLVPIQASPDLQAALDKIYNQTLARTYVNAAGERIMLSIAYGADQSDNLQVHLPEGCYTGQGFAVQPKEISVLTTSQGDLRVARSVARLGLRVEPITYWIVMGNKIALNSWEMKKAKMSFNLRGEVAEGTLLRVSNIATDVTASYELHRRFVDSLLGAIDPSQRIRFFGETQPIVR
jgi:EpsI family protein